MPDKLAPPVSPHFGATPVLIPARELGLAIYLHSRCDILEYTQERTPRGALREVEQTRASDVPCHIARMQVQRGQFATGGLWDAQEATATSSSVWMIALPWDTTVTDRDRIRDRANGELYSVLELDRSATYGVFTWCRVEKVGVHPNA